MISNAVKEWHKTAEKNEKEGFARWLLEKYKGIYFYEDSKGFMEYVEFISEKDATLFVLKYSTPT